ncbi:MAG: hypothetical protein ACR2GN_02970 [Bacteroidia bacterium]|nr:hypothetical protein [Nitrosopumilus sp.]
MNVHIITHSGEDIFAAKEKVLGELILFIRLGAKVMCLNYSIEVKDDEVVAQATIHYTRI